MVMAVGLPIGVPRHCLHQRFYGDSHDIPGIARVAGLIISLYFLLPSRELSCKQIAAIALLTRRHICAKMPIRCRAELDAMNKASTPAACFFRRAARFYIHTIFSVAHAFCRRRHHQSLYFT